MDLRSAPGQGTIVNDILVAVPTEVLQAVASAAAEQVLAVIAAVPPGDLWPEWMAVETAARYLDISPERLRKLQARREVPFYQEGPRCRVLFRRRDLDDWMASFQVTARRSRRAS
jgi:excisionase family DNA binding protein